MKRSDFIQRFTLAGIQGRADSGTAPADLIAMASAEYADAIAAVAPFDPVIGRCKPLPCYSNVQLATNPYSNWKTGLDVLD